MPRVYLLIDTAMQREAWVSDRQAVFEQKISRALRVDENQHLFPQRKKFYGVQCLSFNPHSRTYLGLLLPTAPESSYLTLNLVVPKQLEKLSDFLVLRNHHAVLLDRVRHH